MRKLIFPNKISSLVTSFAIGFSVFIVSPVVLTSDANAQYHHKGGVVLSGRSHVKRKAVTGNQAFGRTNNNARSGVRLKQNNFGVVQRQRQIARRNEQVLRQNELRLLQSSTRRSRPNGRFLSSQERGAIIGDTLVGSGVVRSQQRSACPTGHNCGYRIYSDGTGPRIITPGLDKHSNLPDYDGLSGPKVITLD